MTLNSGMKKIALSFLYLFLTLQSFAGEKKFTITGEPIVTVFANYHAGFGRANKESGFELERCYLGYQFAVTEKLSGKVIFDIGSTKVKGSDIERVAYIKNAFLTWKPGDLTLDFGLVKTEQFSLQESFWGYRYIFKSFDDEYKFSPSADLGIIAKYKFTDVIKADLSITNGEGYKKLNKDNHYRYGAGITLQPHSSVLIRTYYDLYTGHSDSTSNQHALSFFAGYEHSRFRIGAEYNLMYNSSFESGADQSGGSVFTSVNLCPKFTFFSRYDYLTSTHRPDDNNDGQLFLTGIQYTPIKYLKLSPNFRTFNPRNASAQSFIYLNLEFKL